MSLTAAYSYKVWDKVKQGLIKLGEQLKTA